MTDEVFELLDDNICIFNDKLASYLMLNKTGSFSLELLRKSYVFRRTMYFGRKIYNLDEKMKIFKEIDEFIHESKSLGILIGS